MASRGAPAATDAAFLAGLLQGQSVEDAARAAGMSPRTASRRLASPAFQAELRRGRQRLLDRSLTVLAAGAAHAAAVLIRLSAQATAEQTQLAAATRVLELAYKGAELVDLAARLEALEQRAAERPVVMQRWRA